MASMKRTILRAMGREDRFGFSKMKLGKGNRAERRSKKKKK